ncbi:MAG TPA: hypothetical protein VFI24_03095 [Pyrinomonadaceae bacterium]|nr:hypothetical protein [Pyrinomonadaceae bacterium]
MKKISELVDKQLEWVQPSILKMQYELHADDQLAATLRFRSSFGSFATGESTDGCWTFKRIGFWQTKATVRACDTDADIATFKNNTWSGGGTLELSDGRKILATTNFWQTSLEFQDELGGTLINFKTGGLLHLSAKVTVEPHAFSLPELPWMIMFGWYLTIMMHMDSVAVTA